MKSCVFVLFFFSVLILFSSQEELLEETIIVHPMVLESRERSFEKLLVIHDGYSLKLTKASVLAEKLLLRDITDNGVIDRYVNGKSYENALYQDSEQLASLVVKPQSKDDYHIAGIVNSTHFIEPILTMGRSLSGRTPHKLSRLQLSKNGHDSFRMTRRAGNRIYYTKPKVTKLELPQNFTIEMVFISDSSHTKYFKDVKDHIHYVSVLMLGVGLRLQLLDPPGRIALTAILGCSTAMQEKIFLSLSSDDIVLGEPTLMKMSNYAIFNDTVRAADVVYLATTKSINRGDHSANKNSKVLGLARIGGACEYDEVAIGMDRPPTYSGLHTAAHEIGHLLGCDHDGERNSAKCSEGDGYIMHPQDGGERHHAWSRCSKAAVRQFLQSPHSECLHKIQSDNIAVLPNITAESGTFINGQEYCQSYFQNYEKVTYVKISDTNVCRFLCKIEKSGKSTSVRIPAPEGTPCNKHVPTMVKNCDMCCAGSSDVR